MLYDSDRLFKRLVILNIGDFSGISSSFVEFIYLSINCGGNGI